MASNGSVLGLMPPPPLPPTFAPPLTIPSYPPEDDKGKIRKPYTITKSRENWTEQEHEKFLEALTLFDRDWKKIEAFVGSKTVIQIRSHAQKYFLKVQKNGTGEHVPPPRLKRKAAQPYPQNAPKSADCPPSPTPTEEETKEGAGGVPCFTPTLLPAPPRWIYHGGGGPHLTGTSRGGLAVSDLSRREGQVHGGSLSPPPSQQQQQQQQAQRATPDFAAVYRYLGSVFDPGTPERATKLREMDAINRETTLVLMQNLSINIATSSFEDTMNQKLASWSINDFEGHPVQLGRGAPPNLSDGGEAQQEVKEEAMRTEGSDKPLRPPLEDDAPMDPFFDRQRDLLDGEGGGGGGGFLGVEDAGLQMPYGMGMGMGMGSEGLDFLEPKLEMPSERDDMVGIEARYGGLLMGVGSRGGGGGAGSDGEWWNQPHV